MRDTTLVLHDPYLTLTRVLRGYYDREQMGLFRVQRYNKKLIYANFGKKKFYTYIRMASNEK